jgi:hypothetical protein
VFAACWVWANISFARRNSSSQCSFRICTFFLP